MSITEKLGRFIPESFKPTLNAESLEELITIAKEKGVMGFVEINPSINLILEPGRQGEGILLYFTTRAGRYVDYPQILLSASDETTEYDSQLGLTHHELKAYLTASEVAKTLNANGVSAGIVDHHIEDPDRKDEFKAVFIESSRLDRIKNRAKELNLEAYPIDKPAS